MSVIDDTRKALKKVHKGQVLWTVHGLERIRERDAKVFVFGNGGGAAHAMHFAADLRKIAGIKAYSFDSIPEMTARINDQGWEEAWWEWMRSFGYCEGDDRFIFSVGGGLSNQEVSKNLPPSPMGIVGANGGYHSRIVIPSTSTPVVEGCQAVIAHDIVDRLAQ